MLETKISGSKYRVTRKVLVHVTSDLISCSSPVTAVVAADNLTDYETLLCLNTRDGIVIDVEFVKEDGALVEEIGPNPDFYEFKEEDLTDIKESFGIK